MSSEAPASPGTANRRGVAARVLLPLLCIAWAAQSSAAGNETSCSGVDGFWGPNCALCESDDACSAATGAPATCDTAPDFSPGTSLKSFACSFSDSFYDDHFVPGSLLVQCGAKLQLAPSPAQGGPGCMVQMVVARPIMLVRAFMTECDGIRVPGPTNITCAKLMAFCPEGPTCDNNPIIIALAESVSPPASMQCDAAGACSFKFGLDFVQNDGEFKVTCRAAECLPATAGPATAPDAGLEQLAAESASPSSAPIGAIVGGVLGGVAALAVLAILVLRARKGRPGRQHDEQAGPEKWSATVPPLLPTTACMQHTEEATEVAQQQPDATLPASYVTSMGGGAPGAREPAHRGACARRSLLEEDAVLSFINSHLPSHAGSQPPASSSGRFSATAALLDGVQQWVLNWQDLQLECALGRGTGSWTYRGSWCLIPVAVTVLLSNNTEQLAASDLELPESVTTQHLQEEVALRARMRHPHIANFLGLCTVPPCIVTEYCPNGSLSDVLKVARRDAMRASQLTWHRRLRMATDAATGMLYLHLLSPAVVHRNLKPTNLLVGSDWSVVVADFALTHVLKAAAPASAGRHHAWQAPELLSGGQATPASDVYAFALVLHALLTWQEPWAGAGMVPSLQAAVLGGGRPQVPPREALPGSDTAGFEGLGAYCQLMRLCWDEDPAKRPPFAVIVPSLRELLGGLDTAHGGSF